MSNPFGSIFDSFGSIDASSSWTPTQVEWEIVLGLPPHIALGFIKAKRLTEGTPLAEELMLLTLQGK